MNDGPATSSTEATRGVVEAAYRAFGARDIGALLALLGRDVEWGEPDNPRIPSAGTRRGIPGVIEWLTKVVGRPTGRAYDTDFVHLVKVADGKVIRFQEFFDTWIAAEAFRAEQGTGR